jgi:hypothetical protein
MCVLTGTDGTVKSGMPPLSLFVAIGSGKIRAKSLSLAHESRARL